MNRALYFNYIEERLSTLATRIESRGRINFLDLNNHSENFYSNFLNLLFGWQLANLNATKQNAEAIDLIDTVNKIILQVSATATKQKIEDALAKDLSSYTIFVFKFVSLCKDAKDLRTKTFVNPHGITFLPQSDIFDVPSILNSISALGIEDLKKIKVFIKDELGTEVDVVKLESNLATIINVLAKEDLSQEPEGYQIKSFEIERKITFNSLAKARSIVDDYKIHYGRVDKIYSEFNRQGVNKSLSVLGSIRAEYLKCSKATTGDDLFFKICELISEKILNSANFSPIPYEELELCVNILVVDAFIRCKIFENPEGYNHVVA
jgi:hypothetical protein